MPERLWAWLRTERAASAAMVLAALFAGSALTHAMVASPVYAILPTYYAANTAVTLAQIGTIAAFSRIIDALNDPVMGHLSDRTRTRFGELDLTFEPVAFSPVLLVHPDGRQARFPRAMARVTTADGRSGGGWIEWNQPPNRSTPQFPAVG